jgi:hypothetical protein
MLFTAEGAESLKRLILCALRGKPEHVQVLLSLTSDRRGAML